MAFIDVLRRLISKTEREQHAKCMSLLALARDRDFQRAETAKYLYDLCVEQASIFVQEETRKPESPFRGVSRAAFFHEILTMTFWLMDKKLFNGKKVLLSAVHDIYFRSFSSPDPAEKRTEALEARYRVYKHEWDEISGHQDEFGAAVAQQIFGTENVGRIDERSFWIVWYADDLSKLLGRMKKIWKAAGFTPAAE
ncbi:MAG: hypothetical protein OEW15_07970 [Nitrospirota bacterium]|nr:hypothetical protein [Nitrospirota bacterium]